MTCRFPLRRAPEPATVAPLGTPNTIREARLSFAQTVLLGALAGFTIFLGLPVGRLRLLSPRSRVALAMFAVGILAFIFVDVLSHADEIVEEALDGLQGRQAGASARGAARAAARGGFTLGSAGLGILERRLRPEATAPSRRWPAARARRRSRRGGGRLRRGRDAAARRALQTGVSSPSPSACTTSPRAWRSASPPGPAPSASRRADHRLRAPQRDRGLRHRRAAGGVTPSWRWIGLVGLIGGGPTFLGAMLGYQVTSEPLELAFYAVAGGAILYVIGEIWHGMRRYGHRELGLLLLAAGFTAGILTDLVVAYGGG